MLNTLTIKQVKTNLGNWCKTLRKSEKLTQQELATELGMSRITISNLENGENFTIDTLLKILQYFGQMDMFNQFVSNQNNPAESLY